LTFVNLCEAVTIDITGVRVYGDNIDENPPRGNKLNKSALVTMYG